MDVFHTGFVVPDLEAGMAELTELLGCTWAPLQSQRLPLRTPDGDVEIDLRFTYSTVAHHLELIEAVPGTVWAAQPAGSMATHHVGIWSDDVAGDSERLARAGSPCLMTYQTSSGRPAGFAYHRLASGALIEFVDVARKAVFAEWFAGGSWRPGGGA